MKILCVSGKRESGKSLLASRLEHYHGWTRFSLADDLKREVMRAWGLTSTQLWGNQKEAPTTYQRPDGSYFTARDIMIQEGNYRRSIDPLYYCKKFDSSIGDKIVIDDIRFANERIFFRVYHKAKFVRLEREIGKPGLNDPSETELDSFQEWDWTLRKENNVNASDLQAYASYLDTHFLD